MRLRVVLLSLTIFVPCFVFAQADAVGGGPDTSATHTASGSKHSEEVDGEKHHTQVCDATAGVTLRVSKEKGMGFSWENTHHILTRMGLFQGPFKANTAEKSPADLKANGFCDVMKTASSLAKATGEGLPPGTVWVYHSQRTHYGNTVVKTCANTFVDNAAHSAPPKGELFALMVPGCGTMGSATQK
jgi:hypothetical protein